MPGEPIQSRRETDALPGAPPLPAPPVAECHEACPDACSHRAEVFLFDSSVEIDIAIHAPAPLEADLARAIEARWQRLLPSNPRLFAGPILSITSFDASGRIRCARETYKALAVQPEVATGAELLAVIGLITMRDAANRTHLLLGQRGPQVRIYPGLWEVAPAGGINPPPPGVDRLGIVGVLAQLEEELEEEIGARWALKNPRAVAAVRNPHAHSLDIVIRAEVEPPGTIPASAGSEWEYAQVSWMPMADVWRACDERPETLVPQTLAVLRAMRERLL
ncbi:MAG: hypothetical protein SFZ23_00060 [Planctomycetota bacterium]|nr:hypothetical protein [Planctomycetota bacterium]